MGAKIVLTGTAKGVQQHTKTNKVGFTIVTGPASKTAPKGLKLFGETRYVVECSARQWRRARFSEDDNSDLTIEGFQEPRHQMGKTYIAVVAMSIQSMRLQKERKLKQLTNELEQSKAAFAEAKDAGGMSKAELEPLAARLVKASDNLAKFREYNPDLGG